MGLIRRAVCPHAWADRFRSNARQATPGEIAAELFGLLSTPVRLKIISAACQGERNVSELLSEIATTQPNMSQHLATLHRAGILSRLR